MLANRGRKDSGVQDAGDRLGKHKLLIGAKEREVDELCVKRNDKVAS